MFDVSDDAKGEFRRIEVLTGPGRRRRWSADERRPGSSQRPWRQDTRVRGCAALADLLAAGIWLATSHAAGLTVSGALKPFFKGRPWKCLICLRHRASSYPYV